MIRIRSLSLRAGDFRVRDVSLDLAAGEYFVLLGPNGSGKTLLIHCLCGLLRAESGSLVIGDRDVTGAEPRVRRIGYVPQDYGLFPHMNVARNLTFALRAAGRPHADALRELAPLIDMLHLAHLLDHSPQTLSGGERQKVALARALALRPELLLLDEPVSALDGPTRAEVLEQLRTVQHQFGVTTMHVCHSIDEAETVADRAGVMIDGRLVQTGKLAELMARPANAEVARLLQVKRNAKC
jgi:molybdate/tungstate transport system ATP-binding protein